VWVEGETNDDEGVEADAPKPLPLRLLSPAAGRQCRVRGVLSPLFRGWARPAVQVRENVPVPLGTGASEDVIALRRDESNRRYAINSRKKTPIRNILLSFRILFSEIATILVKGQM
jgi:hypothetical protein